MNVSHNKQKYFRSFAKAGLITKGLIYCLIGLLAFMAAFKMGGASTNSTNKSGALKMIEDQTGGQIMLIIIALGLVCYGIWRGIQAIADSQDKGTDAKGLAIRARYMFSGLAYASVAWAAFKMAIGSSGGSGGNENQNLVQALLTKPFGQWLVGIVAICFAAVGVYQCYYGLSEKFKDHVNKSVSHLHRKIVTLTGKIGYIARGVVWIVIGILFLRAAIHSSSSQAGSTSDAFKFLSGSWYGAYLVAALGIGLIFFGAFSFVRARYEKFNM